MKAVTIRQPWARCVAIGRKNVENRGQPTNHRGEIAIHAGQTRDPGGDTDPRVVGLFGDEPSIGVPHGAVIAVADLVDCHMATGICVNRGCHPWGEFDCLRGGQTVPAYHLVFDNVRMLDRPVPARGQVSVPWTLPPEVEEQVRAQLEQVTS